MRYKNLLDIAIGNHMHEQYHYIYPLCDYIVGADIDSDKFGKFDADRFDEVDANNKLPYGDNEFEVVLSEHTIEHLKNPELFYKEIQRIASKKIIITTPHWISERFDRLFQGAEKDHGTPHLQKFNPKWFNERTHDEWYYQQKFTKKIPTIRGYVPLPIKISAEIIIILRRKQNIITD